MSSFRGRKKSTAVDFWWKGWRSFSSKGWILSRVAADLRWRHAGKRKDHRRNGSEEQIFRGGDGREVQQSEARVWMQVEWRRN